MQLGFLKRTKRLVQSKITGKARVRVFLDILKKRNNLITNHVLMKVFLKSSIYFTLARMNMEH